jgi:putative transposase
MLKYKCERSGLNVIVKEESYTSKASFLNLDFIPSYKKNDNIKYEFSGYREKRGVYKIKGSNIRINADVNGSYNILRKVVPNAFADGIEGFRVIPSVIKIEK